MKMFKVLWDESEKPPQIWKRTDTIRLKIMIGDDKNNKVEIFSTNKHTYEQYKIKDEMVNKYGVPIELVEDLIGVSYEQGVEEEAYSGNI